MKIEMNEIKNLSFVLSAPGKVSFQNRPCPTIDDAHDVLVKVAFTGICGSDLHYYRHGRVGEFVVTSPMTLGHESSGVVQEVGPSVTTVKVGDHVALEAGVPCRLCGYCKQGKYNLCREMRFAATPPYDGTLADVYRLPEDFCHKLPSSIPLDHGALIEPLSVAVHVMLTQAKVTMGDKVIVFGAGPIGLLCCAVAKAYGAEKVVVVDINKSRLKFAQTYAATDIFDAGLHDGLTAEEMAHRLITQSGMPSSGADIVVDATGAEPSIMTGINSVRPGGTFVQAGMGRDIVNFPISAMCSKELNVKGSFRYGPGDYKTAIRLVEHSKIDVGILITKRVPFTSAEKAFMEMSAGTGIKSLIAGPSF